MESLSCLEDVVLNHHQVSELSDCVVSSSHLSEVQYAIDELAGFYALRGAVR